MAYQNPANQGAADKSRQRSELQRNIIMLEADKGKKNTQKTKLEAEIREYDKNQDRLKLEMQAKQLELKEIEQEIATMDASVKNLKKNLNLI
jgi:septal ring factor EnvC (AmiA/AmiB activator)